MKNTFKLSALIFLLILLTACGESTPTISHIVVKSDSSGVLLDTTDSEVLASLQKIFDAKEEQPDGAPEFRFFVDIKIGEVTTRWQYSKEGYIRNYEETASMIYLLKEVAEFNRTVNINQ